MAVPTPETIFSLDILGNYVCNTFAEAVNSGPFDVIVIGGGTFGLALAQDLFFRGKTTGPGFLPQDASFKPPNYRILVLEAGPLALIEHVQDIPNLGLFPPGATPAPDCPLPATCQQLIALGLAQQRFRENWGLPWNSTEPFGGLAYCLGGRSLYFGGWSPQYLDTEMPTAPAGSITLQSLWPPAAVQDLQVRYFLEAAKQTGATTSNDFINGALHDFYRQRLFQNYSSIPDFVPLVELPDYTTEAPEDVSQGLQDRLSNPPYPNFRESLKLDAPLAVQILSRPGFFPFNKFSSVPLAITSARAAYAESPGNDSFKRLMIVPNCHVKRLRTRTYTLATGATVQEVDGIDTGSGFIDLAGLVAGNTNRRPVVVLALGAIESARLALLSAGGVPNAALMGTNFMVHLRKNVSFTAPVPSGVPVAQELTQPCSCAAEPLSATGPPPISTSRSRAR